MTESASPAAANRSNQDPASPGALPGWARWVLKAVATVAGLAVAAAMLVLMLVAIALAVAYPNLPDIGGITDYQPKLPMRIFASDGVQIGEFGEERRR